MSLGQMETESHVEKLQDSSRTTEKSRGATDGRMNGARRGMMHRDGRLCYGTTRSREIRMKNSIVHVNTAAAV